MRTTTASIIRRCGNQFADQINFQQGINKFRMFVIDPRISIAHLFAPDGHRQESQRWIIQTVIVLIRLILYPIVKREVAAEESWPRVGNRFVGC